MDLLERRRMMMAAAGGDVVVAQAAQFSGAEYTDLGIYGDSTTSVYIDFWLHNLPSGYKRTIFGNTAGSANEREISISLQETRGNYGITMYGTASMYATWSAQRRYQVNIGPDGYSGLGTSSESGSWSSRQFSTHSTLKLGYSGTGNYFIGTIYKCQISKNGVLVMDLVPAYNKRINEYGFVDLLTGQFYGSVTGTPIWGIR